MLTCRNGHIHACAYCLSQIKTDVCSICRVDVFNNAIRDLNVDYIEDDFEEELNQLLPNYEPSPEDSDDDFDMSFFDLENN